MLKRAGAVLVVVDVQGRLARLMWEKEALFAEIARMIEGAGALGIPVIWMEQSPAKLGPTVPEVAGAMPGGLSPIPKASFSCWGQPEFVRALEDSGRRDVLLCGIETHVCVYQTARDLVANGYRVQVVADAVSSRKVSNRGVGLRRIGEAGAQLTTVETCLFEMLGSAEDEAFRAVARIVK
jgi:nicotinamidase-related amidase